MSTPRRTAAARGIVPALSLFMATIYAPFAIAGLLGGLYTGAFNQYLILKIFLAMAIGTGFSAWITTTPLVVAPAIGLTVFFAGGINIIPLNEIYLCSLLAGAATIAVSLPYWGNGDTLRHKVLEILPEEIKQGVKGGVGALLAEAAVEDISLSDHFAIACIVFGFTALFAADFFAAWARAQTSTAPRRAAIAPLLRLSLIAVPVVIFALCTRHYPSTPHTEPRFSMPGFAASLIVGLTTLHAPADSDILNIIAFAFVIVFIFLTDIPGTPYELLSKLKRADQTTTDLETDHARRAVRNSFIVDGLMAIGNAVMGIPPSIYYSENHILKNDDSEEHLRERWAALYYCFAVLLIGFGLRWLPLSSHDIATWSRLAVAPVLLMIGIRIIASSMRAEHEANPQSAPKESVTVIYYLPTAITIVLSPIIGLQRALPIGLLAYCLDTLIEGKKPDKQAQTIGLLAVAIVFLLINWVTWHSGHSNP